METMNTVLSAFLKLQNLFLVPLQTRSPLPSFRVTCPRLAPTLKKAPLGALDSALACRYLGYPSSQPGIAEPRLAPPLWGAGARETRAGILRPAFLPLFSLHPSAGAIFNGTKINERAAGQL